MAAYIGASRRGIGNGGDISPEVFVAPSRFAAGLPHKVHEAAARGIPVVATSLLAEQLGWRDGQIAIADDAEEFATRCVELYQDQDVWNSMHVLATFTFECDFINPWPVQIL